MRHQLEFFKSFLLKMKLVRIHHSNVKSWEAVGSAGSQLLKLKAGLSEKTCFFTVLEAACTRGFDNKLFCEVFLQAKQTSAVNFSHL